ncbi:unnamed protein product [Urochloa humidicola]
MPMANEQSDLLRSPGSLVSTGRHAVGYQLLLLLLWEAVKRTLILLLSARFRMAMGETTLLSSAARNPYLLPD